MGTPCARYQFDQVDHDTLAQVGFAEAIKFGYVAVFARRAPGQLAIKLDIAPGLLVDLAHRNLDGLARVFGVYVTGAFLVNVSGQGRGKVCNNSAKNNTKFIGPGIFTLLLPEKRPGSLRWLYISQRLESRMAGGEIP